MHGFWNPRAMASLPSGRRFLWVATRGALVAGFVGAFGSHWMPPPEHFFAFGTRVMISAIAGVMCMAAVVGAMAAAMCLVVGVAGALAQLLNVTGEAIGLVGSLLPLRIGAVLARTRLALMDAARQGVMQRVLDTIEAPFIARIAAANTAPPVKGAAPVHGVLCAGGEPLVGVWEATGPLELRDVIPARFDIELGDGERIAVQLETGAVSFASEPATEPVALGLMALLPWGDLDGARGDRARAVKVRAGAQLRVLGGEWRDAIDPTGGTGGYRHAAMQRVLHGTVDAPVWIEVRPAL